MISNTRPLYVAGIGARITSTYLMERLRQLAIYLASCGFILRSGGAEGADTACEIGALCGGSQVELWLPWPNYRDRICPGFYPDIQHFEIAATLHPVWEHLPRYTKYLHARNVGQILGQDCNTPVEFVICWTADGCESEATRTKHTGGTGTAITLASRHNIPVFNLQNDDTMERIQAYMSSHLHYPSRWNEVYELALHPKLPKDLIYVFGSNTAGRHGKGAALEAVEKYGAIRGHGIGIQGQSYAIPTKDKDLNSLPLDEIKQHVQDFVEFTKQESFYFYLTPIGCGLAGYKHHEIAPMFKGLQYTYVPDVWIPYIF